MKYIYNVVYNGKTVNIESLPEEDQKRIKEKLSNKIAETIAIQMARRND